ncbi:MAG: hypothetical protein AAAB13_20520 [Pseudomonas sp.]
MTVNVCVGGSGFCTLSEALAYCETLLPADITVLIDAGLYHETSVTRFQHPFGHMVDIVGPEPASASVSSVISVTGTGGGWNVALEVNDASAMIVGRVIEIYGTSGVSKHEMHRGAWKVVSIDDATHVTVMNTTYNVKPPVGAISASVRVFLAQINFTGCGGYIFAGLGGFSNCAIVGDGFTNGGGIWNGYAEPSPVGRTCIGPHLAIVGFGIEGVRANYGGIIAADSCVSSGNGNNGFMARDTAQLKLNNCVSSGNGWLAGSAPGGCNGFLSQDTSSVYAYSCQSIGNLGDGYYSRMSSNLLCDNGGPCISVGNFNGFRAALASTLQSVYGQALYCLGNGFKAQESASLLVSYSIVNGAVNGYIAISGSNIDARNSNASGIASTPYYADGLGTVTMSGAAGVIGSYPTANAARSSTADFGRVIN